MSALSLLVTTMAVVAVPSVVAFLTFVPGATWETRQTLGAALVVIVVLVVGGLVVSVQMTGDAAVGMFFMLMLFGVPLAATAILLLGLGWALGAWRRGDPPGDS